jgi:hypothetical protein
MMDMERISRNQMKGKFNNKRTTTRRWWWWWYNNKRRYNWFMESRDKNR